MIISTFIISLTRKFIFSGPEQVGGCIQDGGYSNVLASTHVFKVETVHAKDGGYRNVLASIHVFKDAEDSAQRWWLQKRAGVHTRVQGRDCTCIIETLIISLTRNNIHIWRPHTCSRACKR